MMMGHGGGGEGGGKILDQRFYEIRFSNERGKREREDMFSCLK